MSILVGRKIKLVSVVQPSNIVEVNTGLTKIDAPSIAGEFELHDGKVTFTSLSCRVMPQGC